MVAGDRVMGRRNVCDLSLPRIRALCSEIIDYYFSRNGAGHMVTVQPGKYLIRKGIFNTMLAIAVLDVLLSEYKEVRWNGKRYVIAWIDRNPARVRYVDDMYINDLRKGELDG